LVTGVSVAVGVGIGLPRIRSLRAVVTLIVDSVTVSIAETVRAWALGRSAFRDAAEGRSHEARSIGQTARFSRAANTWSRRAALVDTTETIEQVARSARQAAGLRLGAGAVFDFAALQRATNGIKRAAGSVGKAACLSGSA